MKHRILILGTLGEFVQLVKKAKERGYYTVVCDGYPDGEARAFADASYVIPVTDIDAVADLCQKEQIDGIVTSFSDLLLECLVKIADKVGLPCYLKPEQLPYYRDKAVCRDTLKKLQLPTPGFARISTDLIKEENRDEIEKTVSGLSYPLLCKPLDKYGSRGVFIINGPDRLLEKLRMTAEFTDLDTVLIEEYNDGYEFNMMTWVCDGRVHVISIADREKTSVAEGMIPISTRNVYPSRLLDEVEKPAKELLENYIACTGQKEGALSMQFFWKPGHGIQVCEIAARFFGYEHELTDIVYGLNIEELLLDYLYDKESAGQMLKQHDLHRPLRHGAVIYFQGRLLKIADQSAAQKLGEDDAVIKAWIFYREGEEVIEYGPNPYLALYYVSKDSREELDALTEHFYRDMSIRDPEGKEIAYTNHMPAYPA